MTIIAEYNRGYRAGRKWNEKEMLRLTKELVKLQLAQADERHERIYFRALAVALEHCDSWTMGGNKIHNMEGYSALAEIMAQQAMKRIPTVKPE